MGNTRTTIIVAPDAPAGTRELAEKLASDGMPSEAEVIYRGRNIIARYRLGGGNMCNIKAFRLPHLANRLAYGLWRGSKAQRAHCNALRLAELGVRTPAPYAYVELHGAAHEMRDTFFLSEQLPDGFAEIRHIIRRPDAERMCEALAAFVADFHKKGVWMKDLSPGNVLARTLPDGKGYEFALVDINRMEFGVADKMLLMRSCGPLLDSDTALRMFGRRYAALVGLDPEATAKELVEYRRRNEDRGYRKKELKLRLGLRKVKDMPLAVPVLFVVGTESVSGLSEAMAVDCEHVCGSDSLNHICNAVLDRGLSGALVVHGGTVLSPRFSEIFNRGINELDDIGPNAAVLVDLGGSDAAERHRYGQVLYPSAHGAIPCAFYINAAAARRLLANEQDKITFMHTHPAVIH